MVPTEKNSAVYGMLTSLTITAGQKSEETEAAEKFVTFMEQADNIADWVMMSPGAALPVNKAVVTTATWKDNDVIKALGDLPNQLISELPNWCGRGQKLYPHGRCHGLWCGEFNGA